jgi:hypothetical protein
MWGVEDPPAWPLNTCRAASVGPGLVGATLADGSAHQHHPQQQPQDTGIVGDRVTTRGCGIGGDGDGGGVRARRQFGRQRQPTTHTPVVRELLAKSLMDHSRTFLSLPAATPPPTHKEEQRVQGTEDAFPTAATYPSPTP